MLCIDYYEAFQRKNRANSWNDCHSRVEVSRQQAQKKICWDFVPFRACNFQHVSLASGRTVFSSCGADPSKAKKRLSAPTSRLYLCLAWCLVLLVLLLRSPLFGVIQIQSRVCAPGPGQPHPHPHPTPASRRVLSGWLGPR
jgi:hypothetical protein